MTILWGFRKLQGELISLRSSTQLENLLSLRLQPAKRSNLILFSDALPHIQLICLNRGTDRLCGGSRLATVSPLRATLPPRMVLQIQEGPMSVARHQRLASSMQ